MHKQVHMLSYAFSKNQQSVVLVWDAVLRKQKQEENAQEIWLLPSVGEVAFIFKN